jgi:hypothetical protein
MSLQASPAKKQEARVDVEVEAEATMATFPGEAWTVCSKFKQSQQFH